MDEERAKELFSAFGPVKLRRMFSGHGVYADGLIFALDIRDALYLKSDAATAPAFEREGCEPFSYTHATGKLVETSYRRAPERLLEDPDEMAAWARKSFAISRAAAVAKPKKPKRRKA